MTQTTIKALFIFCCVCTIATTSFAKEQDDSAPLIPVDLTHIPDPIPTSLPLSRYGNPDFYAVNGQLFKVLKTNLGYEATGYASWYGTKFHGKRTSSGERYNMYEMTAASPVLPIPSFARVTNLKNGRSVIVKINDRGPFHANRIMDLSYAAASKLGIIAHGTGLVKIVAIDTGLAITKGMKDNYLQVAAFAENARAQAFKEKLNKLVEQPIHLVRTVENEQPLYRILIGPVTSSELSTTQSFLAEHGIERGFAVRG